MLKLHNYKTQRLAAYANDGADARSIAYTQILAGFAIMYATDSILVVVDGVEREIVAERHCMRCFKFVVRWNFVADTIWSNTFRLNSVSQSWI